ncbi:MAG: FimB/Mfa2 family fimbrial subunit [Alistipes sp.]|jgi:hypothetical protein|nr:FimB/Mfa2 family fimbrial subunit [Alistipes sp.]
MKRELYSIALLALSLGLGGCVKESWEDCFPPIEPRRDIEEAMIVRAYDNEGNDITISDRFFDGTIMVFDAEKKLIRDIRIPREDLGVERVIPLPEGLTAGDVVSIAAWGNIRANMFMLPYNMGDDMSRPFVALAPDTSMPHHMLSPGDVFYGAREFTVGESDSQYDEVTIDGSTIKIVHNFEIRPLNAHLDITVRGLPAGADERDYYFRLRNQSSGYTLGGTPFENPTAPAEIHKEGMFNMANELVSAEPYQLVPSLIEDGVERFPMMIEVMQSVGDMDHGDDDSDISLAGIVMDDIHDDPIELHTGMTTHVLIELGEPGEAQVQVKVLPWGEMYQWSEWE